jgi:hypothetical protein
MKILAEFGSLEGDSKNEVLLRLEFDATSKSLNVLLTTDTAFQRKVVQWLLSKHSYVMAIPNEGATDSTTGITARPIDNPDFFVGEVNWMEFESNLGVWGRIVDSAS